MSTPWLHPSGEDAVLRVWVQPRASRNEIAGVQGEELKVRLTSPPVEGAANKLCREYFASLLRVAKGQVELLAGEKSRHKRLLVRGVTAPEAARLLSPHLPPEKASAP